MSQKLEIIRGDDTLLSCAFTDENDDVVDITTANLTFSVREAPSDVAALLSVIVTSGNHLVPTSGTTQVLLPHASTDIEAGNYYWDIQLTYGSGIINSVGKGTIIVNDDITK